MESDREQITRWCPMCGRKLAAPLEGASLPQSAQYRASVLGLIGETPASQLNVLAWYRILSKVQSEIAAERDYQARGGLYERAKAT